MNQGANYLQAEVRALQAFNKYQSDELNAQRSMMNGLMGHVDMHVTRLGSHFHEEQAILTS
eukprot:11422243-Prorocentrum_lima.AAC.1